MPLGESANGGVSPLKGTPTGLTANGIALGLMAVDAEKIRVQAIPMYSTLNGTTTSGYDTFRVPTTHDFLISEVRAHIVPTDHANFGGGTYTAGDAGIVLLANRIVTNGFADQIAMRALNALIDLKNSDREQKLIDNHSMSIGALHPLCGGKPIEFGALPQKVPAGETLRLDVRFASTSAANAIAGDVQYGVVLVGTLIRVAKS